MCLAEYPEVSFRVRLNDKDKRLVRTWPPVDDQERLLHARSAEVAALRYYENVSPNVLDTSVLQVEEPEDERWRTHDIQIDGQALDVKNARVFKKGRYVSHFVKEHKQTQGDAVTIVGVASRVHESYGSFRKCTVLGQVDLPEIEKFKKDLRHLGTIVSAPLDVVSLDINRIAGWLLEYCCEHYKSWERVRRSQTLVWRPYPPPHVNSFHGESIVKRTGGYAWAQSEAESAHRHGNLAPWFGGWSAARSIPSAGWCGDGIQEEFRGELEEWVRQAGLTRRSVFWFVCLFVLANQRSLRNRAARKGIHDIIFPPRLKLGMNPRNFPFGLHDPGRFVWNMLKSAYTLIGRWTEGLENVTRFELRAEGILHGYFGQKRRTILAYCGGCGKSPLIAGAVNWCDCERGRLKCDVCGYCLEGCPDSGQPN